MYVPAAENLFLFLCQIQGIIHINCVGTLEWTSTVHLRVLAKPRKKLDKRLFKATSLVSYIAILFKHVCRIIL